MHCAALWLQGQAKAPVSASLHLLFTTAPDPATSPWREEGIMVRHAEDSPPCPIPASKPSVRLQSVSAASRSLGSSRWVSVSYCTCKVLRSRARHLLTAVAFHTPKRSFESHFNHNLLLRQPAPIYPMRGFAEPCQTVLRSRLALER